ncbi:hypothetical protein V6259_18050 [Marinomonas sp. TI.3.20]|uniref:hypothetical protein n=1 Tax=Marinomonas sp. TI.3.20 TaxID=3121296 RepID=UPI00311DD5E8
MNLKSITITAACILTAGCSFNKPMSNTDTNKINEHIRAAPISNAAPVVELTERLGYKPLGTVDAVTSLKRLDAQAQKHYLSTSPRDVANLVFDKMIYIDKGNPSTNLRGMSLKISRGDSRLITADDIDIRYSGLSMPIRVTYSLTQHLVVNGKDFGVIEPETSPAGWTKLAVEKKNYEGHFIEAYIPISLQSHIGARIYY